MAIDRNELLYVAQEYGTPSFVLDEGAFQSRMRAVQDIAGENVALCFAIKANPFFIPAACAVARRLEVCSPGELDICKALGVDPAMIVFSGVNKTPASVRDAADFGVGVMTAESLKHVALIEAEGASRGEVLDVLLRLNAGSQFGMSRADLLWVIERRAEYPHVNIVGVHYFANTQRKRVKHQLRELGMLMELFDEVRESHGFELQRLEYGPGLAVPLFDDDDFSDTLAPMREMRDSLLEVAARVDLTVEMGRFFAAECGAYLTSVNDVKSNEDIEYCIVDGGINHLNFVGNTMGMKTPVACNLSALSRGDDGEREWCVCGSLCANADVLARALPLTALREGDVLAFENAGAYSVTEGVYLFLSRTMPRIIMRKEDGSYALARDFVETSVVNTIACE